MSENILPPKEKAEEIFNEMKGFRVKNSHSKKCGLFAIRLVLESSPSLPILGDAGYYADDIALSTDYWKKVEEEYLKLETTKK